MQFRRKTRVEASHVAFQTLWTRTSVTCITDGESWLVRMTDKSACQVVLAFPFHISTDDEGNITPALMRAKQVLSESDRYGKKEARDFAVQELLSLQE